MDNPHMDAQSRNTENPPPPNHGEGLIHIPLGPWFEPTHQALPRHKSFFWKKAGGNEEPEGLGMREHVF
jgi:hypothetical protein